MEMPTQRVGARKPETEHLPLGQFFSPYEQTTWLRSDQQGDILAPKR
jgi:hypothetical protein